MNEMKPMTPIEIANIIPFKMVKKALSYHYPKANERTLKQYGLIFKKVKNFKPEKQKHKGEFLDLGVANEHIWGDGSDWSQWYSMATNKYSMSLRPWRELASIPFSKKMIETYKFEELMAHFLWELTWDGWTETAVNKKQKEIGDHLLKAMKEINADAKKCTEK